MSIIGREIKPGDGEDDGGDDGTQVVIGCSVGGSIVQIRGGGKRGKGK